MSKKKTKIPGLAEMKQRAAAAAEQTSQHESLARQEVQDCANLAKNLVNRGNITPICDEIDRCLAAAVADRSRDKSRQVKIHLANNEQYGKPLLGPRHFLIGDGGERHGSDQATLIAVAERHAVGQALAKRLRNVLGEGFSLQSVTMTRDDDYDIDQGYSHREHFEIVITY